MHEHIIVCVVSVAYVAVTFVCCKFLKLLRNACSEQVECLKKQIQEIEVELKKEVKMVDYSVDNWLLMTILLVRTIVEI